MSEYKCPECGNLLFIVRQDEHSMLNQYQFDAIKAGDYVCEAGCKGKRSKSGLRYYWKSELIAIEVFK